MGASSPNYLDRIIGWLSPQWGARRAIAHAHLKAARQAQAYYDGATVGRRGASIRRSLADANVITSRSLGRLRGGIRDLARNNPHAKRIIEAIVSNTIGIGIAPHFLRGEERAQDIEDLADLHLETTDCDTEGRHTYAGLQSVAFETVVRDGEVLVRRRWRRARDGLTVPMQYQILEPDYLDSTKNDRLSNGRIVQGVEYDAIGRRVAYWLFPEHPGGDQLRISSRRVSARDVIHVYRSDRGSDQARGLPWLAPILLRLADYDDYEDATVMLRKVASCFAAFVTESIDGSVPNMANQDDQGLPVERIQPAMIQKLPVGTDVKFGQPPHADDYEPYARVSRQVLAAGAGVSYEAITGDLRGVNFSSGKMGRVEFQRNIDRWQRLLVIPQLCVPMMRWFLEGAALTGANVGGVKVRHQPPRREMIDPPREGRADRDMMRSGQKTLFQTIRESGRDPVEHLQEIAEGNRLLDELGIELDSDPRKRTNAGLAISEGSGVAPTGGGDDDGVSGRLQDFLQDLEDELPSLNGRG